MRINGKVAIVNTPAIAAIQPRTLRRREASWELGDLTRDTHLPSVYLAGKVSQYGWRERLIGQQGVPADDALHFKTILKCSGLYGLQFLNSGPFACNCDHDSSHAEGNHGAGLGCSRDGGSCLRCRRDLVFRLNKARIDRSTGLFAYIDAVDCYGTLSEIGYANAKGIPVGLAYGPHIAPQVRDDLWFVERFAWWVYDRPLEEAFVKFFVDVLQSPLRSVANKRCA
jgi:hypothetical protein